MLKIRIIPCLDFKDGNWQGFFGKDVECIIDLEKTKVISSIGANFYQYINSWIFLPENIQTSTSKDSTTWTIWDKKEDFSESKKCVSSTTL